MSSQQISTAIDLSALFGLDMDISDTVQSVSNIMCPKCHGKGKFISYTGRVVGNCFACEGTGIERSIGVVVKSGDCEKCFGTGSWRPGRPCFACNSTSKKVVTQTAPITVEKIEQAFLTARNNGIKTPKLRLDTFVFSRAPDTGRNAGSIYVKEAASSTYLGKVTAGTFQPARECDTKTTERVIAAAANPAASATAYGFRTGSCSCCGRELTNKISIDLGIGPICRDKYGW